MKVAVLQKIWVHPANNGVGLAAIIRALRWELRRRLNKTPFDVPLLGGIKVRCDPSMRGSHVAIVYRGLYDFHDMMFLRRYLRPGDNFLDVGANIGLYAMMVSRLIGPTGHIDAIEAVPRVAARLRLNAELNNLQNMTIHEVAVSDSNGVVRFKVGESDDLTSHIPYKDDDLERGMLEVQSRTLDTLVGHRCYAAAQLDVEGAEPIALQGAQQMLAASNPPVIFIEMNGRLHGMGWTEKRFADWLNDHGYDICAYDAQSDVLRTLTEPPTDGRDNVLAISRAARADVLARLEASRGKYARLVNTGSGLAWP